MPTKDIDPRKALGIRIKQLRTERQITQEELADSCGMFRTYLSRIESGLANPTLTVLHTLAAGFEMDVTELLATPASGGEAEISQRILSKRRTSRGRVAR
ncbi:MAG: helix-turn-helix transcriptional regulator [Polaromonas sp.]|nr:helix-turn-helix transcriptional regulator [Polaromonas sp.]